MIESFKAVATSKSIRLELKLCGHLDVGARVGR
jgi:hypothetical protein